ncbi:hypothetical protein M9435_003993 [Picochlorum sp. BPE23]|nr:hypothetical protein M9435_003993 [Picochlorum sp. BPE23]
MKTLLRLFGLLASLYITWVSGEPWPYPMDKTIIGDLVFLGYDGRKSPITFETMGWTSDILEDAFDRYKSILMDPRSHMEYEMNVTAPEKLMDGANRIDKVVVYVQTYDQTLDMFTSETYSLRVDSPTIVITSQTVYGAVRALETLAQSCHVLKRVSWKNRLEHHHHHHHHHHHDEHVFENVIVLNETAIYDSPRFRHRGLMVDTARHFLPIHVLKTHLDAMVMTKMNVLHWHMTDDESFPFVSEEVPGLAEAGAFGPAMQYTGDEIEDVIRYARKRGIRVIVEIDSPGHTGSFAKSHPEMMISCGKASDQKGYPSMSPAAEETYDVMWRLFREVARIFPDRALHFGGDEIDDACWKHSSKMKKAGFDTPRAVAYHVGRLMEFASTLGKVPVIWGDLFDRLMSDSHHDTMNNNSILPPTTIVQLWTWNKDLSKESDASYWLQALKRITKTHRAILSSPWYINLASKGTESWKEYWSVEPLDFEAGLDQKDMVLGGEAVAWGEHIDATNSITATWPLAAAVGERLWSPESLTDIKSAQSRIDRVHCRMLARGIQAAPVQPGECPLITTRGHDASYDDDTRAMNAVSISDRIVEQ